MSNYLIAAILIKGFGLHWASYVIVGVFAIFDITGVVWSTRQQNQRFRSLISIIQSTRRY